MRRGKRLSTVLIADTQLLFRRGLRALFTAEADLEVIGEAASFSEVQEKLQLLSPDVLVIGLEMLDLSDREFMVSIRGPESKTALLVLAHEDADSERKAANAAGPHGHLSKSSSPSQLITGIRRIIAVRDQGLEASVRNTTDLQALAAYNRNEGTKSVLTPREQEVVRLLADGRTVREVALDLHLSVKTVEAHKLNLMRKLDIHNRASLLDYAARNGLVAEKCSVMN